VAYGISKLNVKEPSDGTEYYLQWFILVLDGGRRLGKDLQATLKRYMLDCAIAELAISSEESVYLVTLPSVRITDDMQPGDDTVQNKVLDLVKAFYEVDHSKRVLSEHAQTIQEAFPE